MKYKLDYISTFHMDVWQVTDSLKEYPQKAVRIFSRLDKILGLLVDMPEMYPVYEPFPMFRKITIEDYAAFYTINEETKLIEVHRLLYGRMDMPRRMI